MKIEELNVDNLREGIFCPHGSGHAEEMYGQMQAWIEGDCLRGRVARSDDGQAIGFILYYPVERAPLDIEGEGVYVVQCLYVKPEHQNRGVGKALIEAALANARVSGATGFAMEGFREQKMGAFSYVPGTFLQHMGMTAGESRGPMTLYYVEFQEDAMPPQYMTPRYEPPEDQARVRVDIFDCRKCYVGISNREVVKTVMEQLGDEVSVEVHDQNTREAVVDKGMSSGVFIGRMLTYFTGPISEDDVWTAINAAKQARDRATDR